MRISDGLYVVVRYLKTVSWPVPEFIEGTNNALDGMLMDMVPPAGLIWLTHTFVTYARTHATMPMSHPKLRNLDSEKSPGQIEQ